MSTLSDMSAAGERLMDLLTVSEAAVRLRCSAEKVRRLVAEGVLAEERFGVVVRITPESVDAEYVRQHGGDDLETGHTRDPEGDEAAHG